MTDLFESFQKMSFIYKAILDGWAVKMISTDTFEFKKNTTNQEVNLDNYVGQFVAKNLDLQLEKMKSIEKKKKE